MICRYAPLWFVACCTCLDLVATARADTLLHLSDTATVMVAPDEISAALRAEATSLSASDAQGRVNAAMQDALTEAGQVAGITVSTGGYAVWRTGPTSTDRSERWQVSQTINLTARDGAALMTLVGHLQQKGLAVSSLGWHLSRAAERRAHQEATKQALIDLHDRVENAAAVLDLRFGQYKDVRLDGAGPRPMIPTLAAPMAMSVTSSSAPPPSAATEDVPVSATADADAILLPR